MTTMTPYGLPRYTISLIKETTPLQTPLTHIRHGTDIFTCMSPLLAHQDREHMYGLFLDTKFAIIGIHHIAMGSLNSTTVHPREVFKCTILLNAAEIAICHNHPSSGDPSPSPEDRRLTTQIANAGKLLGIRLLDHVIIGHERHYSFADHGALRRAD